MSTDAPHNGNTPRSIGTPPVTYIPSGKPSSEPVKPERKQIILFLLTCVTTTLAGVRASPAFYDRYPDQEISWQLLFLPENLLLGLPFASTLLLILGVHEMGHFLAARRWRVHATLPYFIPIPTIIGTMGAVIRIKSRIPNRRALFDIGVAGPIAGFVIAIIALAYGYSTAEIVNLGRFEGQGALIFGDSLLTSWLQYLIVGEIPAGYDLMLDPVGFAGWLGLFVTVLNLLPIGQFDGGHLVYARFGDRHEIVSKLAIATLFGIWAFGPEYGWLIDPEPLSTWFSSRWPGWLIWGCISIVLGRRHPPTLDPVTSLDPPRRWLGYLTIGIFVVCFIPNPIRWVAP